jgi:hypothetical protein
VTVSMISERFGPDGGGFGGKGMSAVVLGTTAGMRCVERLQVEPKLGARVGDGNLGSGETGRGMGMDTKALILGGLLESSPGRCDGRG